VKTFALLLALAACQSSDVSRSLGARCDVNADCAQTCLGPSGDWPGGFCTIVCDQDSTCEAGARCISEDNGVCAFECVQDPDCKFLGDGYTCKQVDDRQAGAKVMVCRGG
jgi:hypothetical protein